MIGLRHRIQNFPVFPLTALGSQTLTPGGEGGHRGSVSVDTATPSRWLSLEPWLTSSGDADCAAPGLMGSVCSAHAE